MPLPGILNAAHGLSYYSRLQEVTANNLANVSTDAFKVDRMTGRLCSRAVVPGAGRAPRSHAGRPPVDGRSLDLAIDGPGFLVVQDPAGERLTRGGSLKLDASGQLTDADGNPVLGDEGPDRPGLGTLEIQIRRHRAGRRSAALDHLRSRPVPTRPRSGRKAPAGSCPRWRQADAADAATIRQGNIEEPNSDAVLGMIDLVTIQRAYAANVDALKAMDGVLGTVTSEVGRV